MIEHNQHIVSKVRWETSFNDKEQAHTLQSEISRWSKLRLENELNRVFDEFCPAEQVWKINALEIDLGTINYSELNGTLSKEFSKALSNQLKELLFYSNHRKGNIEIINRTVSILSSMQHFLLNGYMVLGKNSESKNAQDILNELLKDNRSDIINLIRTEGHSSNVRRRIAWQFNDDSLDKIVEGLEPNNHEVVIEFKDKLLHLQEQERVVQSSTSDFHKEAWFWILTHLLVDRGTLFNKVEFMKSLLTQMSARYNVDYKDLMNLVERAIKEIELAPSIQSDFISTLKIISTENAVKKEKTDKKHKQATDYWKLLDSFLLSESNREQTINSADVNDLIMMLSHRDKSQFSKWLLKVEKDKSSWSKLIDSIHTATYSALVSTLASTIAPLKSDRFLEMVNVSFELLKANQIEIKQKELWKLSLDFLIENKTAKINSKSYTKHLIDVLSKQKQLSKVELLVQLSHSKHWPVEKSKTSIDLYESISFLHKEHQQTKLKEPENIKIVVQRLNELLKKLDSNSLKDAKQSRHIYELLLRWIQTHPKEVFNSLLEFEQKENLQEFLNVYLKNQHAQRMVENVKNTNTTTLFTIHKILKELKSYSNLSSLAQHIEDSLMLTGVQVMLVSPSTNELRFIKEVLKQSSRYMSKHQLDLFNELIDYLFAQQSLSSHIFPEASITEFKKLFQDIKEQDVLLRTHELISVSGSNRKEIGQFLLNNFNDQDFSSARLADSEDASLILDYFVPKGSSLKTALISEALRKLSHVKHNIPQSKVASDLLELFWKCVLLYSEHYGIQEKFSTAFNHAIAFHFNRNTGIIKQSRSVNPKQVQLKTGKSITSSKLQSIVSKGIKDASVQVEDKGSTFDLKDCIALALEMDAQKVQRQLLKIPITKQRANNLAATIPFTEFCLLMSSQIGMKAFFDAIRALHEIVEKLGSKTTLEKIVLDLWMYTWQTIQATRMDSNRFSKLVQQSIFEIAKEKNVKAAHIFEKIKSEGISVNPTLKESLIKTHEVFSILPDPNELTSTESRLEKCEHTGLLEELCFELICNKQLPSWFTGTETTASENVLNSIIKKYPIVFLKTLRYGTNSEEHIAWISKNLDAEILIKSIIALQANLSPQLNMILKMHQAFYQINTGNISGHQLQDILLKKVLIAWSSDYWALLSPKKIWNELMWEFCTKKGISSPIFLSSMQTRLESFPPAMQIAIKHLSEQNKEHKTSDKTVEEDKIAKKKITVDKPNIMKEAIPINNAGVVLLNDYIKMLFDRLGLLKEDEFISKEAQVKAVHYLQYLITGRSSTEESYLVFNKVLCGLGLSEAISSGIEISSEEKALINGLIEAMIGYWSAIGETSIEGFRGNWLVRDGLLSEQEDKWELNVERRPYDILIQKSPFAFSIIKYPWMDKPVHVTWAY